MTRYEQVWAATKERVGPFRGGDLNVPGVTTSQVILDLNYLVSKGALVKVSRGLFCKADEKTIRGQNDLAEGAAHVAVAGTTTLGDSSPHPSPEAAPVISAVEQRFREFRAGLNIRPQRTWEEAMRDRGTKRERGGTGVPATLGKAAPIAGASAAEEEEEEES